MIMGRTKGEAYIDFLFSQDVTNILRVEPSLLEEFRGPQVFKHFILLLILAFLFEIINLSNEWEWNLLPF